MAADTSNKFWRPACLAAWLLACLPALAQTSPAPTLRHGIVSFDGEGGLTLVTARPVPPRGEVVFQYPDDSGEPVCCKRLPVSAFRPVALPAGGAMDVVSGQMPAALRTAVSKKDAEMPFVGAAVLGDVRSAKLARGGGLVAMGQDGRTATSTTCISAEGFHVIEKAGKDKGQGRVLAHLYLNLGYEVEESTCR